MCTLIAIHGRVRGKPLVVAANRDEYLDRPAESAAIRALGTGPVLAPLDVRAGGTWLGLSQRGVFAALTNLRTAEPDPLRRSRGRVVFEALEASSADEAAKRLERLETSAFNPFNLFVADRQTAFLVVYRERAEVKPLAAGVHVVGNVEAEAPDNEKVKRISEETQAALAASGDAGEGLLERLASICRHHGHEDESLRDTCVHVGGTYGTRSSVLLELDEGFDSGRFLQAAGPPCVNEYEDFSSLLSELRCTPEAAGAESMARAAS